MNTSIASISVRRFPQVIGLVVFALLVVFSAYPAVAQLGFVETNLVSDIPGLAANFDSNLKNPWGITSSETSPFWVSDNGTGLSTIYNSSDTPWSAERRQWQSDCD